MSLFLCSSQHLERLNNPSFHCFYFLILKLSRGHTTHFVFAPDAGWPQLRTSITQLGISRGCFKPPRSFRLPPLRPDSLVTGSAMGLPQHPAMSRLTYAGLEGPRSLIVTGTVRLGLQALFTVLEEVLSKRTDCFK